MIKIPLSSDRPHIELCDLLKVADLCESGGIAKREIAAGKVKVDGMVDTRKRAKIKKGQTVEYRGEKVTVT